MVFLRKGGYPPARDFEAEVFRLVREAEYDALLLVPTRRKARALLRDFARRLEGRSFFAPRILTLQDFAGTLLREFNVVQSDGPPPVVVTPDLLLVTLENALRPVHLPYFGKRRGEDLRPGMLDRVFGIIQGLKEDSVTPEDFARDLEEGEEEVVNPALLADLHRIYEAYERALEEKNLLDPPGIFLRLEHLEIGRPFGAAFPRARVIFMQGFSELKPSERNLLLRASAILPMQVAFDCEDGNPALFGNVEEEIGRFVEAGFTRETLPEGGETARLKRNLFRANPETLDHPLDIRVLSAADARSEADLVAREIVEFLRANPEVSPSRIAVCFPAGTSYPRLLRDTLFQYNVPYNVTERPLLGDVPSVLAALSLLRVPVSGFYREDVLRTLSNPYFDFPGFAERENLRRILAETAVVRGRNAWLQALIRIRDQASRIAGESDEDEARERMESCENALRDFRAFCDIFADFNGNRPAIEWATYVAALLARVKYERRVLLPPDTILSGLEPGSPEAQALVGEYERNVLAAAAFMDLPGRLGDFLDEHVLKEPCGFDQFLDYLQTAASGIRVNLRERAESGVLVTAMEEIRGLELDCVFILGLVDGMFPKPYRPERFLGKRLQKTEAWHRIAERYLFMQVVTTARRSCVCTWPRLADDRDNVRSRFLDALVVVAPIEEENANRRFPENLLHSRRQVELLAGAMTRAGTTIPPELARHLDAHVSSRMRESARRDGEEIITALAPETDGYTPPDVFSVTELELYAQCPFKYFASRLLRLQKIATAEPGLSPLVKGVLVHRIAFEFFIGLRERNLLPLSGDDRKREEVEALLARVARDQLARESDSHPFFRFDVDAYFGVTGDGLGPGVLKTWMDMEWNRDLAFVPRYFEVEFGGKRRKDRQSDAVIRSDAPIDLDGLKIRGKVDRLDAGEGGFLIIDYKTGAPPAPPEIEKGISLQVPLYLAAMERLLASSGDTQLKPAGGAYCHMAGPGVVEMKFAMMNDDFDGTAFRKGRKRSGVYPPDGFHELMCASVEKAKKYAGRIREGRFPVEPYDSQVCRYCDFFRSCRFSRMG